MIYSGELEFRRRLGGVEELRLLYDLLLFLGGDRDREPSDGVYDLCRRRAGLLARLLSPPLRCPLRLLSGETDLLVDDRLRGVGDREADGDRLLLGVRDERDGTSSGVKDADGDLRRAPSFRPLPRPLGA